MGIRVIATTVLCMVWLMPVIADAPSPEVTDQLTAGCRLIVAEFKQALMGEFMRAMKEGGPSTAIRVCRDKAPAVAADYSELEGWSIRRTALRTRNPNNNPDDFERATLMLLELDTLTEYTQWITDDEGNQTFRYMSAIDMAQPCVTCHGPREAIDDSLETIINENYPEDHAVGFDAGDLRGAFSLTVSWPAGKHVADSLAKTKQTKE
ncbi:MAG: hypothetical protein Kow0074_22940 [Candidatus Zixiibacteriota bacterium]